MQASDFSDVFVSYRRMDVSFVKQLYAALHAAGREIWVDWEDIPPGSIAFTDDIRRGIDNANAFLCVLSPRYLESEYCLMELDYAVQQNKRLIPVVLEKVDGLDVPDAIGHINWIFFVPHAGQANTFDESFPRVIEALEADLGHVRAHTRLLKRAQEWETSQRNRSFLLRGAELGSAEKWLTAAHDKDPEPLALHREFIQASEQAQSARQRTLLVLMGAALVVTTFLMILSVSFAQEANEERSRANAAATGVAIQRNQAEANLIQAQRNQSRYLASVALDVVTAGDPATGLLLAIESLENYESGIFSLQGLEAINLALQHPLRLTGRGQTNRMRGTVARQIDDSGVIVGSDTTLMLFDDAREPVAQVDLGETVRRVQPLAGGAIAEIRDGLVFWQVGSEPVTVPRGRDYTIHPDGTQISVWDRNLVHFYAADGTETLTFDNEAPVERVQFDANTGNMLFTNRQNVTLRDAALNELGIIRFQGQDGSVAVSPVSGQYIGFVGNTAFLWDAAGEVVTRFAQPGSDARRSQDSRQNEAIDADTTAAIEAVEMTADGQHVIVMRGTDGVTIWTSEGDQRAEIPGDRNGEFTLADAASLIVRLDTLNDRMDVYTFDGELVEAFDDISRFVGATSQHLVTHDVGDSVTVWSHTGEEVARLPHEDQVGAIEIEPNARYIATNAGETVTVWTFDGLMVGVLPHTAFDARIQWSSDGRTLTLVTPSPQSTPRTITPNGYTVTIYAVGDADSSLLRFGGVDRPDDIRWNEDRSAALARYPDGQVGLWRPQFRQVALLDDALAGDVIRWHPDSTRFVSIGDASAVNVLNVDTEVLTALTHSHPVIDAIWRKDGTELLTWARDWNKSDDAGEIIIWSAAGEALVTMTHDEPLTEVAQSADEAYILAVTDDNMIHLWTSAGDKLWERAHSTRIWSTSFHPEGDRILTSTVGSSFSDDEQQAESGPGDDAVHVWSMEGELLASIPHDLGVYSAWWSSDGSRIISVSSRNPQTRNAQVSLWTAEGDALFSVTARVRSGALTRGSDERRPIITNADASRLVIETSDALVVYADTGDTEFTLTEVDWIGGNFRDNGSTLELLLESGSEQTWIIDPDALVEQGRAAQRHDLSQFERDRYFIVDDE